MLDQSQTCPSCRSSKYSNPQLKLMVNVCGHPLCENCVEVLFVRGSGLCVQCKTPIRKTNFRYQLFEDPSVQKEIDIRRKVLADFNKREDDFDCLEDFDLYLEKIEEIVYNLTNDINVEETKRYIESYKKENKDLIKKNRLRPSSSLAFYEAELEREALIRQQREREELEEQNNDNASTNATEDFKNGRIPPNVPTDSDRTGNMANHTRAAPPSTAIGLKPPPTVSGLAPPSVDLSRSRFVPPTQAIGMNPVSTLPGLRALDRLSARPPPPSALGGFVAPPSMMPLAPPSAAIGGGGWLGGVHHPLQVPSMALYRKQQDTVLLPSRHSAPNFSSLTKGPGPFVYEPYEVELGGPTPPLPTNHHVRWSDIVQVYDDTIMEILQPKPAQSTKSDSSSDQKFKIDSEPNQMSYDRNPDPIDIKPKLDEDGHMIRHSTNMEIDYEFDDKSGTKTDSDQKFAKSDDLNKLSDGEGSNRSSSSHLVGLSHRLPAGACGIAPCVFLERCLHESRCGLFM